ncbi:twin-arginine translocase TatA/TatE family subunit [Pseudopedobacter sp.]|uniref:twin-arginine translocase TatA/TatE family subunit n=1 Tax=Pseudopedobacter sp. TaxID=1936787 RepID=UPI00333E6B16
MGLGAPEIILIVVALLLLFGGKKIPELMRGLGKGVKEFKEGQKGIEKEEKTYNQDDKN